VSSKEKTKETHVAVVVK